MNHLLSIDDLSQGDINRLFFRARQLKKARFSRESEKPNRVIFGLFLEPSTRTRMSFESAASRLGFRWINFDASFSSLKKGESIRDTLLNLAAMEPDLMVMRHYEVLDDALLAGIEIPVINAGDSSREHPTQALLDCFTLLEAFNTDDLRGRTLAIVGDVVHSRVARSTAKLAERLKARVIYIAPLPFLPTGVPRENCYKCFESVEEGVDMVMALRTQKERIFGSLPMCDGEYYQKFGVTKKVLNQFGEDCLLLHPGPANIGVEIDEMAMLDKRSLILTQVKNGVFVRASVMEWLMNTGDRCG